MNRKWMLGAAALLMVVLVGYFVRGAILPSAPAPTPTPQVDNVVAPLVADARVVPVRSAALSLPTGGIVGRVLVREGAQVSANQVLLQLDQSHEQARVTNAEAALAEAQASYERLLAGATEEEIAVADAQLRQSQAQARQVGSSVTPQDVQAAQAQINQAQATMARLANTPKDTDKRTVDAQLAQAEQNLALQRDQLSANKTSAELRMRQAAGALVQSQTAYSMAQWNWQEVQRTGHDPVNPRVTNPANPSQTKGNKLNSVQKQQYHDAFMQAEAALHSAEQAVEEAQVAYATAQQAEVNGIAAAEQQVAQAQATRENTLAGAEADQWAAAQAQLAAGQSSLTKLRGTERASSLEAAQSAVEVAEANLKRLQSPVPESELAIARARVQTAQAELDQATLALADTELRAPFAGTVAAIDIEQNEFLASGTPVVQLADFSSWKIETTDLTELNIAEVRIGAPVTLTFDALPGVELTGSVTHIKPFGEAKQGDITYTAVITPDRYDERMYWNMTATAAIMPKDGKISQKPTQ